MNAPSFLLYLIYGKIKLSAGNTILNGPVAIFTTEPPKGEGLLETLQQPQS
jgi:hypothetical protein